MRHRADRRAEVLSRSRRRDGPPGPIIVGCAVRDRRLSFLWGAGTANGADAFAGKTGRAAAEGGQSRDAADGFVALMIDGERQGVLLYWPSSTNSYRTIEKSQLFLGRVNQCFILRRLRKVRDFEEHRADHRAHFR